MRFFIYISVSALWQCCYYSTAFGFDILKTNFDSKAIEDLVKKNKNILFNQSPQAVVTRGKYAVSP